MSRSHTLIWTALLAAAPALFHDSASSPSPAPNAQDETQSPLFDNGFAAKNTIVASNPGAERSSATLEKWTKLALMMQSIAFQPPMQQQQGVTSVDVPGANNSNQRCSSANVPTQSGDCSVYVAPDVPTTDRDLCSAIRFGDPTSPLTCSTNLGNPAAITCSTQGGQTDPAAPVTGTVGCSAGMQQPYSDPSDLTFTCSTSGATSQGQTQYCSTFDGEHQSCSVGNITDGDSGQCSALNNTGKGYCSVDESAPTGSIGNKCSAINTWPDVSNALTCSAIAGNNDAKCSVLSNATGNGACTAITVHQGSTAPQNNACSVLTGTGNNNHCSIINSETGNLVSGPNSNNRCGTFISHEDLKKEDEQDDPAP